jgi:hypothetical protein
MRFLYEWPQGSDFPSTLPSAVTSTVDHFLGPPSLFSILQQERIREWESGGENPYQIIVWRVVPLFLTPIVCSIFSVAAVLLVTRTVYSQSLPSYWSHAQSQTTSLVWRSDMQARHNNRDQCRRSCAASGTIASPSLPTRLHRYSSVHYKITNSGCVNNRQNLLVTLI